MSKEFPYKKALVTGGAGFIGSHIVEELVNMGVETVSVDNYFAGKEENLAHLKKHSHFTEAKCDVCDYEGLEELIKDGVDIIFHQAASKKTICLKDPRMDLDINAKGTYKLLELSRKYNVKKFVTASTGSVYGEAQYHPQDEKHPLVPTSYYGVSKLAGEKYVQAFNHLYGLDTTVLRYFHIYGARQESSDVGGVVSIFIRSMLHDSPITIFGDGTQLRTFTYVKDVVKANINAAILPNTTGEVYNCASGIKVTIKELADMVAKNLNVKDLQINYDDWMPGDIKYFEIDNSKIKEALKIDFVTDFQAGLNKTIDWAVEYFKAKEASQNEKLVSNS